MNERWDVVLTVLNGPLASMGPQTLQGPVVPLGNNPGPGGLRLTGYRGLDSRHAVITAYDSGEATVEPVGSNQVRMGPHPHVDWSQIDPMRGAQPLSRGCAIHLGPVGRGATVQFVEMRRLGMWQAGRLGSDAAGVPSSRVSVSSMPAAVQATRARRVVTTTVPLTLVGCTFLIAVAAVSVVVAVYAFRPPPVEELGPVIAGEEYYDFVATGDKVPEAVRDGLEEPFSRFVTRLDAQAAREEGSAAADTADDPEQWDAKFFDMVTRSVRQHVQARHFFRKLRTVRSQYAEVLRALRDAGMPEVLAALPYTESRYDPSMQSVFCAKGYWQFMPEVANRYGLVVRDCTIRGTDGTTIVWNPSGVVPPARKNAPYRNKTGDPICLIPVEGGCARDERTDLSRSTAAAIRSLKEVYDDPKMRASGAVVQLTMLAHNAGFDDIRFGRGLQTNIRPALDLWSKGRTASEYPVFYGDNIRCKDTKGDPDAPLCGARLAAETQHYGYSTVARHILAVCYYGKNYAQEESAFDSWTSLLADDGYCAQFKIPTDAEVKTW